MDDKENGGVMASSNSRKNELIVIGDQETEDVLKGSSKSLQDGFKAFLDRKKSDRKLQVGKRSPICSTVSVV